MFEVSLFKFNLLIITLAVVCIVSVWITRAVRGEVLFNSSLHKVASQQTSLCTNPVACDREKAVQVSVGKLVSVGHLHLS